MEPGSKEAHAYEDFSNQLERDEVVKEHVEDTVVAATTMTINHVTSSVVSGVKMTNDHVSSEVGHLREKIESGFASIRQLIGGARENGDGDEPEKKRQRIGMPDEDESAVVDKEAVAVDPASGAESPSSSAGDENGEDASVVGASVEAVGVTTGSGLGLDDTMLDRIRLSRKRLVPPVQNATARGHDEANEGRLLELAGLILGARRSALTSVEESQADWGPEEHCIASDFF